MMEEADDDSSLHVLTSLLIIFAVAHIGAKVARLPVLSGNENESKNENVFHKRSGRNHGYKKDGSEYGSDLKSKVKSTKVLILGAGAAGLWAARSFLKRGFDDFILLEGAAYAGGRVHDVEFAGIRVEKGANWVIPESKSMIEIVQKLRLNYHVSNSNSMIAKESHQNPIPEERLKERRGTLKKVMGNLQELGHELINECKPDISQRLGLSMSGWQPDNQLDKTLEWYMCDFEWQDPPHVTSLKSTARQGSTDDSWFVTDQRGYKSIFADVISYLTKSGRLILNKCVSVIDQSSGSKVYVTCTDESIYCADYILTTFSLGVLKHKIVEFIPTLPDWKVQTIEKFRMGIFTKVFIKFPCKFWGDEEWILHVSDRRGFYPTFLNLEANGLFPPGTNILIGFLVGEEACRVEQQPKEETKSEIWTILSKLFASDQLGDIPPPSDVLVTDWSTNHLHMGSFSNWPVDFTREMSQQMQVNVDRVFFGGEATDDLYNGYVIGAMRSGERECDKIMRRIELKQFPKRPPADSIKY